MAGIEDQVSRVALEGLLEVDTDLWRQEAAGIEEFYAKFGDKLPQVLKDELEKLKESLK